MYDCVEVCRCGWLLSFLVVMILRMHALRVKQLFSTEIARSGDLGIRVVGSALN